MRTDVLIKDYRFRADEGFQMIMLELVGKDNMTGGDFEYLIKGLLLAAHEKGDGEQVLFHRTGTFICTKAFK